MSKGRSQYEGYGELLGDHEVTLLDRVAESDVYKYNVQGFAGSLTKYWNVCIADNGFHDGDVCCGGCHFGHEDVCSSTN